MKKIILKSSEGVVQADEIGTGNIVGYKKGYGKGLVFEDHNHSNQVLCVLSNRSGSHDPSRDKIRPMVEDALCDLYPISKLVEKAKPLGYTFFKFETIKELLEWLLED